MDWLLATIPALHRMCLQCLKPVHIRTRGRSRGVCRGPLFEKIFISPSEWLDPPLKPLDSPPPPAPFGSVPEHCSANISAFHHISEATGLRTRKREAFKSLQVPHPTPFRPIVTWVLVLPTAWVLVLPTAWVLVLPTAWVLVLPTAWVLVLPTAWVLVLPTT